MTASCLPLSSLARPLAAGLCCLLLGACGGGGGGSEGSEPPPATTVPLASKTEVLRALSISLSLPDLFASSALDLGAVQKAGSVSAFAKAAQACRDGGTQDDSSVSLDRQFRYFSRKLGLDEQTTVYQGCKFVSAGGAGSSSTETYDGTVASGEGDDGDTGDYYSYTLFGTAVSGGLPYSLRIDDRDNSGATQTQTLTLNGLVEQADLSDRLEVKAGDLRLTLVDGSQRFTLAIGTTPVSVVTQSDGRVQLNGDIEYSSTASGCVGGPLEITTVTPLTLVPGLQGGSLVLGSGAASTTVTFAADGSARITLPDHSQVSATAAEITAALEDAGC